MEYVHHHDSKGQSPRRHSTQTHRGASGGGGEQAAKPAAADLRYRRACRLIESGKHHDALELLNAGTINDMLKNLKGVCLLRMGKNDLAIRVLRNLVLKPGTTWARTGTPALYQTNLCTALLLGGHPSGCLDLLADIADQQHPAVLRLQQAIETWKRDLSFWQRFQLRCGLEPDHPVRLDFPPGDYEPVQMPPDTTGTNKHPTEPRITA